MAYNENVYNSLAGTASSELVAFCASCAERGSAIYAVLGQDDEVQHLNELLHLGWSVSTGGHPDTDLAGIVEEFEESLDDDEADEESETTFHVTQSAFLLVNTLAVHLNPDPTRAAMSGRTLESLLAGFDFAVSGDKSRTVRPGEDSPTGPLQQLEQQEQASFMSEFTDGTGARITPERVAELRSSCLSARNRYEEAVRQVFGRPSEDEDPGR
ncbi:hypothetical protein [Streptomyces cacaoi]|uniref:hypothetical protein n=1 Tax=Streptomyces cacaoi TaxID=1898 RepID=UPI00114217DE|nr:hypothetical protein [Streptomyces cacaoi]NNG85741.1 hypothetical protein [Streptomyces cacaoi]